MMLMWLTLLASCAPHPVTPVYVPSLLQVTKHDDVFMLDGEGMPTIGNPFVKGRLFVIFKASARRV